MSEAERILKLTPGEVLGKGLITVERLRRFAPNCDAATLAPALQSAAETFDIDTTDRAAMWLAQIHIESGGLTRFVENLNYSAARLCAVWPSRFPTLALAQACAGNPQALAEKAYGGRMGNTRPGDGYRYRGRSLLQITGHDNYELYGQILGLDLLGNPDLAAQPDNAARIAGAYWRQRGLNRFADKGDLRGVTLAINGGLTGLADRGLQLTRAKLALAS